ncbi:MAG: LemA family protein [Bacteroidales bacterium]|nr:LemA family protein [Bacteroidales bacterium]
MTLIIIGVLVLVGFYFIGIYNKLVKMRNLVEKCFSGIDVQLKKRYDLIPNLVEAVAGYMDHEEITLTKLAELRSIPFRKLSQDQKQELDSTVHKFARGFQATVENYPELKASENVMHLQRTLNETEEQISASRRSYNAAVETYNNFQMTFPNNLISGMMGYQRVDFFETADEEREAPVFKMRRNR